MWRFIHQLGSPKKCFHLSGLFIPWTATLTVILLLVGLTTSLLFAPADYQQGEGFRIMYLHVPCAILSLGVYTFMAISAAIALIWRIKLGYVVCRAAAPLGAWFTFLALVTGAIWGKPMWGTWWIWDARLTSELILLFLYLGYIALQTAITDRYQAARTGAILLLVGFVDIPIIHFSVNWWNTLHQGASLSLLSKPTIALPMLYPLLIMLSAFSLYFITMLLIRLRTELLAWEPESHWVKTWITTG